MNPEMSLGNMLSKEQVVNGLKKVGKLRIKTSHSAILSYSALILILIVAFVVRILPLRWEIQTGSLHLSEFDPYYQYSLTNYMVKNGLLSPYYPEQWVDHQRWYPGGINMGMSLSSLPMTAAVLYGIVSALGISIDLMSFCSLLPALMGAFAVLLVYILGKDIGGKAVGLFAAMSMALSSAFIQRTALGFFDTETVGIVSLLLFSILFLRAIEEERSMGSTVMYSIGSALALAYFIMGWGAAYYLIGLTVLFALVMMVLKRYSRRLLLSYSLTFGLGLMIAVNNPYISTRYLTTLAVLPVAGVFVLLCLNEIIRNLVSAREKLMFVIAFFAVIVGSFTVLWTSNYIPNIAGKFWSVLDPFLRATNPLVESVAEHRISSWGSMYYDIGVGILFFIAGLFFVSRKPNTKNLFLLLFGLTSLYFASSMVRLLALMAPAIGLLGGIGIVGVLRPFVSLLKDIPKAAAKKKFALEHVSREFSYVAVLLIFLVLVSNFAVAPQPGGVPEVYRQSYVPVTITAGSLVGAPNKPVSEWLDMLKYLNDFQKSSTVVCAWWDYGYWLTLLGNVTSLADNATINATQIQNIGFVFMANETNAIKMMKEYNSEYVLVFLTFGVDGSWIDWAGGDNGKWMWMARISGQDRERFVSEGSVDESSAWTDEKAFGAYNNETNKWAWNDVGTNSTVYKLMSWGKNRWCSDKIVDPDQTAVAQPEYFVEEFFSGVSLTQDDSQNYYGGIVPLICVYKVNWQQYYLDNPSP